MICGDVTKVTNTCVRNVRCIVVSFTTADQASPVAIIIHLQLTLPLKHILRMDSVHLQTPSLQMPVCPPLFCCSFIIVLLMATVII